MTTPLFEADTARSYARTSARSPATPSAYLISYMLTARYHKKNKLIKKTATIPVPPATA